MWYGQVLTVTGWLVNLISVNVQKIFHSWEPLVNTLFQWDRWIQRSVNLDMISPVNDEVMKLWSAEWPWTLVILGFIVSIVLKKNWPRLLAIVWLALTMGISDVSAHYLIKPWIGRIRPCRFEGIVRVVDGCSGFYTFPSNHASNVAVFAVLWFLLFNRTQGLLAMGCAFFIGMSRVYLGVHYPSDVLGGFILGSLLAMISYQIWRRLPLGTIQERVQQSRG